MPGGFTDAWEICNANPVGSYASSVARGTTVTSSGSANTKGSWTQLVASTAADACWMTLTIQFPSNATMSGVSVDIGIGGAGSEVVIVPDVLATEANNGGNGIGYANFSCPISIPAGTRVAARAQGIIASNVCYVGMTLFDGAFTQMEGVAGYDTIGFVSASTKGTAITPSGTNNVKGSYSQLSAATARDYIGYFAALDFATPTSFIFGSFDLDIAIGGAGSEVVIDPDITFGASSVTIMSFPPIPFKPMPIPAGTRVAARLAADFQTTALGLTLYGAYR